MNEINIRLVIDNNIVYPITKAENVIHLQKTVLPKVSSEEPEIKVKGKVWLEPDEDNENTVQSITSTRSIEPQQTTVIYATVSEVSTIEHEPTDSVYNTQEENNSNVVYESINEYTTIE